MKRGLAPKRGNSYSLRASAGSWMLFCNSYGLTPKGMAHHLVFYRTFGSVRIFCFSSIIIVVLFCVFFSALSSRGAFLFTFPHLLGRPSFLYNFDIAQFRIFHRNFAMPVADVTSSPGRSLSSSVFRDLPKEFYIRAELYRSYIILSSCFVIAFLALQGYRIQKALVLKLATQQSGLKTLSQGNQSELNGIRCASEFRV